MGGAYNRVRADAPLRPPQRRIDARVLEDLPYRPTARLYSKAGQLIVDPAVPQDGLSRAISRSACQRSKVRGEIAAQLGDGGSSRASAVRSARSAQDSFGVSAWRWTTATWWRKIKIGILGMVRAGKQGKPANTRSTAK